ncbi:hypothetical protein AWC05_25095 [Mycobacterium florentinum]|uniref:Cytochrome n=1 Tax=Mycobacterium florentinum TaxID=292462 RepID=A0A1X1U7D5_MYCFL|nr:hypothetical protein AWC05_25095 [Mycobacterium florentinum]BBX78866.1 hypothetical protein MFLOJ_26530 [Mycobacterium florentinum]
MGELAELRRAASFNVLRSPNPHFGFGGTGAHYCIGANLARMTIDIMFNAIADHMPDLASAGDPQRLRSPFINGIKHWQVDYQNPSQSRVEGVRLHRPVVPAQVQPTSR